jgi:hypothetical protein
MTTNRFVLVSFDYDGVLDSEVSACRSCRVTNGGSSGTEERVRASAGKSMGFAPFNAVQRGLIALVGCIGVTLHACRRRSAPAGFPAQSDCCRAHYCASMH